MIIPDEKKKHVIASILAIHAKPDAQADEPKDDSSEELSVIAEDMLEAIDKKDPKGLASALHAFLQEIELRDQEQDEAGEGDDSENE